MADWSACISDFGLAVKLDPGETPEAHGQVSLLYTTYVGSGVGWHLSLRLMEDWEGKKLHGPLLPPHKHQYVLEKLGE